jgi:hypothetical protein
MFYITGDVHGGIQQRVGEVVKIRSYDKEDDNFLVVAGDFGLPWYSDQLRNRRENRVLDQVQARLERQNLTVCFVDGNHENYDLLYSYPLDEDGTRPLRPRIRHLPRGGVYRIGGFDLFAFGGALSTDRGMESLGRGYWREELPNPEEAMRGLGTVMTAPNIDLVVTHAAPAGVLSMMGDVDPARFRDPAAKNLEEYCEIVEEHFPFARWYFGHYCPAE